MRALCDPVHDGLWNHGETVLKKKKMSVEDVWEDLHAHLGEGAVVYTLSRRQPNHVTRILEEGFEVMTLRSAPKSQLVPKWMFEKAISHLLKHGSLKNDTLLNTLNVKRSSFVLAALATLEYVDFEVNPLRVFLK